MRYDLEMKSKIVKGFLKTSSNEVILPCLIAEVGLISGMVL